MRSLLLGLLSLPLAVQAESPALPGKQAAAPMPAVSLPLRARLDKDAIRAAIAATPAESETKPRRHEADTLSATPAEKFSKDFANARLPDCLHAEGLRNQPTFFMSGLLALPFIAVAKLRGVCR